jgi:CHASE1-domain containing sensor protein
MPNTFYHFLLTLIIFLCVCLCTLAFISPYSFTSFVGPAAGITSALVIFYGARIIPVIIIATLLYCSFLFFWLNLPVESSLVIITLLAFVLQGFWAKQLTYKEVNKQKWLKSRRVLLTFLLKVGPLNSLISAFSVIILTLLENKEFGDNLFFTFFSCWSGSLLFSIFFTPLFLLYQGRHQLSLSKRFFIMVASLLAVVAIALLFYISQNVQQHQRQVFFNKVKSRVVQKIQHEVALTSDKLNSLSAFIKVNREVTSNDFSLYAAQILQKISNVRVLEWAPAVNHRNRSVFEKNIKSIVEKNVEGSFQKAGDRNRYAPIKYVYPAINNEQVIGYDVLSHPISTIDINNVIKKQEAVASAPISLIQDEYTKLGVLFISPVFSESDNQDNIDSTISPEKISGNLLGFTIAVVQLERFFQQISPLSFENMSLFIEDVTSLEPYILFGEPLDESFRHVDTTYIEVNSRTWRISLGENQPWQLQNKSWQVWGMLLGVTFGGMLFQLLILMMAVYSNELSTQVVRKTRELIIAKEQSDYKSTAKTNFLNTLNSDLQIPLQSITYFTEQLYKTNTKEQKQIIKNIELAQHNMQKLLHMVVDISKIELGELMVNSEPFDLYGFINGIDSMLKANILNKNNSITFLISPKVPHFINSDEIRIQQLLVAFCDGIHEFYNTNNIRVSIKIHKHNSNNATLFFVFTTNDLQVIDNTVPFDDYISKDITLYSTEMAMAREVCQLMNGDVKLAVSASGERVLTASIKINITSNEQQRAYQAKFFDEQRNK